MNHKTPKALSLTIFYKTLRQYTKLKPFSSYFKYICIHPSSTQKIQQQSKKKLNYKTASLTKHNKYAHIKATSMFNSPF